MNLGVKLPFFFFVADVHTLTHTLTHTKECDICRSLVFIDPGMEKWASQFSFNHTVTGIGCMSVCVSVCLCLVDIGCQQILTQTYQGGGARMVPESWLSNWIFVQ